MSETASTVSLAQSVSNLLAWLRTWEDGEGGLHGPVVYHHRDNLKVLRPDTWTQSAAILGLLGVCRASNDGVYLKEAEKLGRYLVKNYVSDIHIFRDSNFDQKPLGRPALEGNALASLSLFELGKAVGSGGGEFTKTASDNVTEYLVRQWDASKGSFAVDYHGGKARIHNKASAAIMAILAYEGGTQEGELTKRYAIPSADFIVGSQVKDGRLAGAFPYADADANYRTIYSLVTSLGLLGIYDITKNEKYLASVERLIENLSQYVDERTGLICHYHKVGYPQWVTDTILFHKVRIMTERRRRSTAGRDQKSSLQRVLSYQYSSGAFPLSLGFEDLWYKDVMKARPEIRRWRDVLPTPGINAWNFWFLTSFLEPGVLLPLSTSVFPCVQSSDREESEGPYELTDDEDSFLVVQKQNREIKLLISKGEDVPVVCRLSERSSYWRTVDSINRYPGPLRRLILAAPRAFMKLRK